MSNVKTPTLDKILKLKKESEIISRFIDDLKSRGIYLARFRKAGNNGKPLYIHRGSGKAIEADGSLEQKCDFLNEIITINPEHEHWPDMFLPLSKTTEEIIADHFRIDLIKAEHERIRLLENQA